MIRFLNSFGAALASLAVTLAAVCAAVAALGLSLSAIAADSAAVTTVKLAQEKLHHFGFYEGRIHGDLSGDTQAALVQFQLSRTIPASGTLDDPTLAALGIERQQEEQVAASEPTSAAGGSAPSEPALVPASPEKKEVKP